MDYIYFADSSETIANAGLIVGLGILLLLVSLVVVCLRVYAEARFMKNITVDGYIIVATWFTCLIFVSLTLAQARLVLNYESLAVISPQHVSTAGRLQYASAPFYILTIFGFKLSILSSYLHHAASATYWRVIVALIICLGTYHFFYLTVGLGRCIPAAKQWNATLAGSCIPYVSFNIASSALTFVFDVFTLFASLPILLHELPTLSTTQRLALLSLYVLSVLTSLIPVERIFALKQSKPSTLILWSVVETNLGIVCCSCISLYPLFARFFNRDTPRSVDSTYSSSTIRSGTTKLARILSRTKDRLSLMHPSSNSWRRTRSSLGDREQHLSYAQSVDITAHSDLPSRPPSSLSRKVSLKLNKITSHLGKNHWRTSSSMSMLRDSDTMSIDSLSIMGGITKTTEVIVSREADDRYPWHENDSSDRDVLPGVDEIGEALDDFADMFEGRSVRMERAGVVKKVEVSGSRRVSRDTVVERSESS